MGRISFVYCVSLCSSLWWPGVHSVGLRLSETPLNDGVKGLHHPHHTLQEGILLEKVLPEDWPFRKCAGHFLDWYLRKGQLTVGGPAPAQVVLGGLRKQTEQAVESTLVSSSPPWLPFQLLPPSSCRECLLWFPWVADCGVELCYGAEINPFLPKLILFMVISPQQWKP